MSVKGGITDVEDTEFERVSHRFWVAGTCHNKYLKTS